MMLGKKWSCSHFTRGSTDIVPHAPAWNLYENHVEACENINITNSLNETQTSNNKKKLLS